EVTVTVTTGPCLNPVKIFTPNSDGFNDLWRIFTGDCAMNVRVDIYNRWGGLVYHSDSYANNWDGTYKGKPLPEATYYYVIKVTYQGGRVSTLKGNVTIMR